MASNSIPPAKRSRNRVELPQELVALILQRAGPLFMLKKAPKVCKTWHRICSDPNTWRVVDMRCSGNFDCETLRSMSSYDQKHEEEIRKAVDLSCGGLIELRINYFVSDDLLRYISDRSSQLRHLCIESCYNITNEGLSEMVKKLPLLEELHLYCTNISRQAIEVAGRCCPLLKSFKLNQHCYKCAPAWCDALAIAENMPGLQHLQLFGCRISNSELVAILENCPRLQSLDIRQCKSVALGRDLVIKLSHIKDLRLPCDSTKDYDQFDYELHNMDCFDEEGPNSGLVNIDNFSKDYDYSDDFW